MSERWFFVEPQGGVTVLFRIDNPTNSEVWIAEGGQKRLLGTYPYQIDYFASKTLLSHLGGVFRDDITENIVSGVRAQSTIGQGFEGNKSNTIPFTGSETLTGTSSGPFTWNIPDLANINTGLTYDNSRNATGRINYAIPFGDYRADGETIVSAVNVNGQMSGTHRCGLKIGLDQSDFLFFGSQFQIYTQRTGATYDPPGIVQTDNQYATLRQLSYNPIETNHVSLILWPQPSPINGAGNIFVATFSGSLVSLDFRFRPYAYLSKSGNARYVGIEYFDNQGRFATDYFELSGGLGGNPATALYPNIPTPNGNDPSRFWITKDKNGLGNSFVLSDGATPDPAFNIVADKLVSFAGYINTAQYNIPLGQTFSLNRTYDGTTAPVDVPGLGVQPDRVLAIADIP